MKIGILTLRLQTNYGGILQAYALITFLKRMGHEVWLIERWENRIYFWNRCWWVLKRFFKRFILQDKSTQVFQRSLSKIVSNTPHAFNRDYSQLERFIRFHFTEKTDRFYTSKALKSKLAQYGFDAIIVGSDQVWRPQYVSNVKDYFLEFCEKEIKRVAYAASFGIDKWTFSKHETRKCRDLAQRFDAISVREESGVELCRQYLDTEALHVLDPTLLLTIEDYRQLVQQHIVHAEEQEKILAIYVLDNSDEKKKMIEQIANTLQLEIRHAGVNDFESHKPVIKEKAPSVEEWLECFLSAEFTFVDSFHGCIFSILFHKPFFVFGNKKRGIARFTSVLKLFGLEDRLKFEGDTISKEELQQPIDWIHIDDVLNKESKKAFNFLKNALKNE